MAYFPFMVDISGKTCLIVGGGRIALHKAEILQHFQVKLHVVAPQLSVPLQAMAAAGELTAEERDFREEDLAAADFVVAATDRRDVNIHVANLCRCRKLPVNSVDIPEVCTFIFPALVQQDDLLVAVSTGGSSPAAAAYFKEKIKESLPACSGALVRELGKCRPYVLEQVPDAGRRRQIFYRLLQYGEVHGGSVPDAVVQRVVAEYLTE